MVQGAENDLLDITFYTEDRAVYYIGDNVAFENLNDNVIIVDDKAILARNTAQATEITLATHIGSVGPTIHANANTFSSGFMSPADKAKLDDVQENAQIGTLSPSDSLELIGRKDTFLHLHLESTGVSNGFMSAADNIKLSGIETAAQDNALSDVDATNLTDGSNADLLHLHFFGLPIETFTEAVHNGYDHTGIEGTSGFSPFITTESYNLGTQINGYGMQVFSHPYPFTLQALSGGIAYMMTESHNSHDSYLVTDFEISGVNGIITFEIEDTASVGGAFMHMNCWQGGWGV